MNMKGRSCHLRIVNTALPEFPDSYNYPTETKSEIDERYVRVMGKVRELHQTFSLQGQTRDRKGYLSTILKSHGFNANSKIGIIGSRYYSNEEGYSCS
jgi:hypothetical protein